MAPEKFAASLLTLLFLAAGIGASIFRPGNTQEYGNSLSRNAEVIGNISTTFALKLFNELSGKNIVLSPLSIWIALAMAYEGAGGETAMDMQKVLGYPENRTVLHESIGYLLHNLCDNTQYTLKIANSIWPSIQYPINESYISLIKKYYDAYEQNLDYRYAERARKIINSWVENYTEGKIKEVIPEGGVSPFTVLVLVNAIYLKAIWMQKFDPNRTYDDYFYIPNGKVKVPMMHTQGNFEYVEDNNFQVLKLPYRGNRLSMLIILPKSRSTNIHLSAEKIKEWREKMRVHRVKVILPRFKITSHINLKEVLQRMGLRNAFTRDADFQGIGKGVYINNVFHKTYIKVGENGTEAAAATAVGVGATAYLPYEYEFRADHPFVFLVQDDATGAILFMGEVADPSS